MNNKYNALHQRRFTRSVLAIAVMASTSSLASAEGESARYQLEEVIVTATKRSESLDDVPVSAVVKSGDALQAGGFDRISDLQFSTPGFAITGMESSNNLQVTMRGISTPTVSSGFSLGTGMYIDGVDQGPPIAFLQELVDVAQVEVLRGPQGTLFGKNTIAGAFNITTKKPGDEREGFVEAEVGDYNLTNVSAALSGPVVDGVLAARGSFFVRKQDGFVDNVNTGGKLNNQDKIGGRVQLRFTPIDELTVDFSMDYTDEDQLFAYSEVIAPIGDGVNWTNEIPPGKNTVSHTYDDWETRKLWGAQVNINYDLTDDLSLTSITGFRHAENEQFEDTDHTSSDEQNYHSMKSFNQFTQEFRVATARASGEGEFDYLVGLYLGSLGQAETNTYGYYKDIGILYLGTGPGTGNFEPDTVDSTSDIRTTTLALFASGNYLLTEDLTLSGGIRIGRENKALDSQEDGVERIFSFPDTEFFQKTYGETNVSPTVGLTYNLNENAMLYSKATRGFKSGGFNTGVFKGGNTDIGFDSESVTNYEVGFKGDAFDRRATMSLALFSMDYEDLQVEVYVEAAPGLPGIRKVTNAATATINGAELELAFLPFEGMVVNLGVAYVDAKFDEFIDPNPDNPQDFSGNKLPNAPKLTGNIGFTYTTSLGDSGDLYISSEYTYRDDWYSFPTNSELERPEEFGLLNARIGFESNNGWALSVWGKNILDEEYDTERWYLSALSQYRAGFHRPATFGATMTYNY